MSNLTSSRRHALRRAAALIAGSLAPGQDALGDRRPRPPREELVNVLEFEDVAKRTLPLAVHSTIAGGDRAAFDRITFRPRMCIPTLHLDLGVELFGEKQFAPILVGPVAEQRRYHADGELAMVRGASAAKATIVISSRSSVSLSEIAAQAKTPLWFSVYADADASTQRHVQQAVAAGCTAVCITIGASPDGTRATSGPRVNWNAIDRIRRDLDVPVVIKGVMDERDAKTAVAQGVRGIIVSNHGGVASGTTAPIEILSSIADVVGGKAVLLVDGSFRRGTDILKALVLGAQAVVLARPVMWGLAAYGADGVQGVIEMLQSDLGRQMGALGAPNLASLNRRMVMIHRQ